MTDLTVYTREDCPLCEELLTELAPWAAANHLQITLHDVDADPDARRRWGHRVPVVLYGDATVCHGRLDLAELARLVRAR